jgi:hypothetical protein
MRGGEPDALQPVDFSAGAQQLGEGAAIPRQLRVGEGNPIGVDVLAEQRDFEHAVVHQRPHLGQDVARTAVELLAAQRRDDAKGAAVVASDGDGNPSGVGGFAGARQRRRKLLQRLGDFHLGDFVVPGAVEQRGQRTDVVRAEDDVDPRRLAQHGVSILLRQAATDRDLQVGIAALARSQVAQVAVQLVVGVLAHGAGVEHHHVGVSKI